jgi:DNA anti-recombination protein RmuC
VETMDDAMVLRQLNYDLRIARSGLKIVKGQAHVVYQENQDLKREVDRLKTDAAEINKKLDQALNDLDTKARDFLLDEWAR